MGKNYTIRSGFTFRDETGGVKVGGEVINLEDDVAKEHQHKLEEVVKTVRKSKPASSTQDADQQTGDQSSADQGEGTDQPDSDTPASDPV